MYQMIEGTEVLITSGGHEGKRGVVLACTFCERGNFWRLLVGIPEDNVLTDMSVEEVEIIRMAFR